ncbi:hypothetical protein [Pseudomonas phage 98PfluR60PP]|uniref:Uncharacterized protein n=1 Tax=Pseudomonas phage 98PfluR60PP TaxID=2163965 RepID=A0A2S1PFY8_9CAUD|nr:hypothetical protein PP760_gp54 [Pseudomonas phage 98PfluR60PP]AWH15486.1 hypothetical protein [Pseudomonas phage 98PfluR60PP]
MSTHDRRIAEILSTITTLKQQLNKDHIDSAVVYLDVAVAKLERLKQELQPDD